MYPYFVFDVFYVLIRQSLPYYAKNINASQIYL